MRFSLLGLDCFCGFMVRVSQIKFCQSDYLLILKYKEKYKYIHVLILFCVYFFVALFKFVIGITGIVFILKQVRDLRMTCYTIQIF